jgi:hypothetical protein
VAHDARVRAAPWTAVAPYLPPERPNPKGGRPRIPDRTVLAGGEPACRARPGDDVEVRFNANPDAPAALEAYRKRRRSRWY